MGKPKRRNDLDLASEELHRGMRTLRLLIESMQIDERALKNLQTSIGELRVELKGIDAQNKALFKLFGVIYKMLAEPDKPHDKFELFTDMGGHQTGSIHDHPA